LKNRLRSSLKISTENLPEETKKQIKARPIAHKGLPFQPQLERKVTEVEPFSFEERDRRLQQLKEEKIRKMQEEEAKVCQVTYYVQGSQFVWAPQGIRFLQEGNCFQQAGNGEPV
jgi:hypothetical protein